MEYIEEKDSTAVSYHENHQMSCMYKTVKVVQVGVHCTVVPINLGKIRAGQGPEILSSLRQHKVLRNYDPKENLDLKAKHLQVWTPDQMFALIRSRAGADQFETHTEIQKTTTIW